MRVLTGPASCAHHVRVSEQIKGVQLLARVASAGCAPRIDASNSTSVLMVCLDKHGTSCDRLTSDILTLMILLLGR